MSLKCSQESVPGDSHFIDRSEASRLSVVECRFHQPGLSHLLDVSVCPRIGKLQEAVPLFSGREQKFVYKC